MAGTNPKKWWWIGCGGCLLVILIAVVAALMFGNVLVKQWQATNTAVNEQIFGQNPEGYTTVAALPLEHEGQTTRFSIMMSDDQHMLFVIDLPASQGLDVSHLPYDQPEELTTQLNNLITTAAAQNSEMDVDQLLIENVVPVQTPAGRPYPLVEAKLRGRRSEEYTPAVIGLLPLQSERLVLIIDMDPATRTEDAQADFTPQYEVLSHQVQELVTDTTLDDRLQASGDTPADTDR